MLVDEAIKQLDESKKVILSWWTAEAVALSCKSKFSQIDTVSCRLPEKYGNWHGIFIHVGRVKSMNDLGGIFNFLGRHGYLHTGKPEIFEDIHRVSWDFGDIKLLAFFTEDESSNCRFVKVKKESETYKLVCPDMAM